MEGSREAVDDVDLTSQVLREGQPNWSSVKMCFLLIDLPNLSHYNVWCDVWHCLLVRLLGWHVGLRTVGPVNRKAYINDAYNSRRTGRPSLYPLQFRVPLSDFCLPNGRRFQGLKGL